MLHPGRRMPEAPPSSGWAAWRDGRPAAQLHWVHGCLCQAFAVADMLSDPGLGAPRDAYNGMQMLS